MDSLNINNLHHAYITENGEGGWRRLREELERAGVAVNGNPDISYERYDVLGIDDARRLHERQMHKPLTSGPKIFYVQAEKITLEAQNALLKTLEEPTNGTHIFLSLPSLYHIIPTLRSRVEVFSFGGGGEKTEGKNEAKYFLSKTITGRLDVIRSILSDENTERARLFLHELEREVAGMDTDEQGEERVWALEEIYIVKEYIHDRSSSRKQLLEHLAHTLPGV